MGHTHTLAIVFFMACLAWNCYECYRMRRHRLKSDLMGHLITVVLQKMEVRQDALIANDQSIARSLRAIEKRITRPQTPPSE